MKTIHLLLILITLQVNACLAQSQKDTIQIEKRWVSTRFLLDRKELTPKKLAVTTQGNPAARQEMKIARRIHALGSVLSLGGGCLFGYGVAGGRPDWTMAGIGAGLIGATVPLSFSYTRHAKKAVLLYNSGLQSLHPGKAVDVKAGVAFTGMGIRFSF